MSSHSSKFNHQASIMEGIKTNVAFRSHNSRVPFVLHVSNCGFATVPEQLLYVRFNLQEMSLLVEKEEFDDDGNLCHTVF
jgi:hypothetical protein